ncbi:MAG: hypothetical protein OK439_01050 [Thaumarchaeota archaeon]|nr:hypothetical protein [Nitrososphaerota archaeon]
MSDRKLLVYVQALPVSISSSARKFKDIETSEFRMSHSSRAALSLAISLGFSHIVAAGFPPILQEALARGATEIFPTPLCDDPLEQVSYLPDEDFSHMIVGENPDWIFSGASICGILAESRKIVIEMGRPNPDERKVFSDGSVILVIDSGESSGTIDVRRIKYSTSSKINPEGVLGSSNISKLEERRPETIAGDATEISQAIWRKIRRIVGN